MVFNTTFNNISVISWQSVLLVEETRVPGENHRPVISHWQTLSHNVVSSTPRHEQVSYKITLYYPMIIYTNVCIVFNLKRKYFHICHWVLLKLVLHWCPSLNSDQLKETINSVEEYVTFQSYFLLHVKCLMVSENTFRTFFSMGSYVKIYTVVMAILDSWSLNTKHVICIIHLKIIPAKFAFKTVVVSEKILLTHLSHRVK